RPPLTSTLFPYTTLFRSFPSTKHGLYTPSGFGAGGNVKPNFSNCSSAFHMIYYFLISSFYINKDKIITPIRPTAETIASIMDHEDRKSTRLNSSHVKISY